MVRMRDVKLQLCEYSQESKSLLVIHDKLLAES